MPNVLLMRPPNGMYPKTIVSIDSKESGSASHSLVPSGVVVVAVVVVLVVVLVEVLVAVVVLVVTVVEVVVDDVAGRFE